tara:strand:- start:2666 stop:3703 length:1038 start_codon:yes stop_codon:yes gene_type:complete
MDNNEPTNILNKINNESKKIKYTELYGNDILFTTIAIIITIIISIYFIILINFKKYHKAWYDDKNNIRCNPVFMPFSKYISTGPLFGKPISGSENLKFCVDKISVNVSNDYDTGFTGIFKNLDNYYNLLIDAVTTVGLLLSGVQRIFFELIKLIMNRFKILSHVITTFIQKVMMTFSIFPLLFSIIWNILLEFINIIKYILIYLVNLLYKCVLGPVASLVETISIWSILLIVFLVYSLLLFFSNLIFGIWPFFLGATIIFAILIVILVPVSLYVKFLFLILLTIINKINEKVINFLDLIDTGIDTNQPRFNSMRANYIDKKQGEGRRNLFSTPSFDDCKKIFKKN